MRYGNELIYALFISFPDAALGTTSEIPTVDGKVKIKIDAGTQSGKVLRLKGKGLPEVNSYAKRDLLVSINVWVPKELNREEKKILEKLATSDSFTPRPDKSYRSIFELMKGYFG
mgnify:FL=1